MAAAGRAALGGTLAVHELRYLAAYGRHAEEALNEQGHAYLTVVGPLVTVLIASAVATVLLAVVRGQVDRRRPPLGFRRAWLSISPALFGVFAAQEFAEGVLASGHPAGLAAIIDSERALIGSANLTNRALTANLEVGVLIRDPVVAAALDEHVRRLMTRGVLTTRVVIRSAIDSRISSAGLVQRMAGNCRSRCLSRRGCLR